MSIAQTCIDKKIITYVLSAALLFGGIYAYTKIGRLEDPEFTIKCAQIITMYPGATAEEVLNEVTDPIEIAVQQLGELDKVTSTSYAGRSIVQVEMKDNCLKADLGKNFSIIIEPKDKGRMLITIEASSEDFYSLLVKEAETPSLVKNHD